MLLLIMNINIHFPYYIFQIQFLRIYFFFNLFIFLLNKNYKRKIFNYSINYLFEKILILSLNYNNHNNIRFYIFCDI